MLVTISPSSVWHFQIASFDQLTVLNPKSLHLLSSITKKDANYIKEAGSSKCLTFFVWKIKRLIDYQTNWRLRFFQSSNKPIAAAQLIPYHFDSFFCHKSMSLSESIMTNMNPSCSSFLKPPVPYTQNGLSCVWISKL